MTFMASIRSWRPFAHGVHSLMASIRSLPSPNDLGDGGSIPHRNSRGNAPELFGSLWGFRELSRSLQFIGIVVDATRIELRLQLELANHDAIALHGMCHGANWQEQRFLALEQA